VSEDRQPDRDPAQVALEEEIGAGSVQDRHGDCHRNDHSSPPPSPKASTSAATNPITTMNTPMSKGRAEVALTVPNTGTATSSLALSRKVSPQIHPAIPVKMATASPIPISTWGAVGSSSTTASLPRAMYRRTMAVPATRPATNPPPGALWPV